MRDIKCRTGKCGTNMQAFAGVENARLENVAQKYITGKCRKGKCGTKPLRVENAGMEIAGQEKYEKPYVK